MRLAVRCPKGHWLKVREEHAGRTGKCPHCGSRVRVPRPDDSVESIAEDVLFSPEDDGLDSPSQIGSHVESFGGSWIANTGPIKKCPCCGHKVHVPENHVCPNCGSYFTVWE